MTKIFIEKDDTLEIVVGVDTPPTFTTYFNIVINKYRLYFQPNNDRESTDAVLKFHRSEEILENDSNKFKEDTKYSLRLGLNLYQFDDSGNMIDHRNLSNK